MCIFSLIMITLNSKKLLLLIFCNEHNYFQSARAQFSIRWPCLYFKGLFVLDSFLGFTVAVGMKSVVTLHSTIHGCSNYGLWLSCVKLA